MQYTQYFSSVIHLSVFPSGFPPDEELLIERSIYKGVMYPGEDKHTVEYKGQTTRLEYSVRVRCDENYYGHKCNKVCRPRDDYFGHYLCDQLGNRECMEGWTNLTSSCKTGEEGAEPARSHSTGNKPLVFLHQFSIAAYFYNIVMSV